MSAPDFGEPWTTDEYAMYAWDRGRRAMGDDNEACFRARGAGRGATVEEQQTVIHRVVACVNACAGMADPEAEIATLRKRVEEEFQIAQQERRRADEILARAEKAERELAETRLEWARSVDAGAAMHKALLADLDAALLLLDDALQSTGIRRRPGTDAAWKRIEKLWEKRRVERG